MLMYSGARLGIPKMISSTSAMPQSRNSIDRQTKPHEHKKDRANESSINTTNPRRQKDHDWPRMPNIKMTDRKGLERTQISSFIPITTLILFPSFFFSFQSISCIVSFHLTAL